MKDWGGGVCYTGTLNERGGGGLTVESLMKDHQDETMPVLALLLP